MRVKSIDWLSKKLHNNGLQAVLLGLVTVAALVIGALRNRIFDPAMFDASTYIGQIARGEVEPMDFNYAMTGGAFRLMGLGNLEWLAGVITVVLVVGLVFWIFRNNFRLRVSSLLMALITIGLSGIWFFGFSKELFEIILVCAVGLFAMESKRFGWLIMGAGIIGYGLLFRPYWVVIGIGYFGLLLVMKLFKGQKVWILLPVILAMIAGMVVGYAVMHDGTDISHLRNVINDSRVGFTKIENILPSNNVWTGMVNSVAGLIWIFVPWQLFVGGKLLYIGGGILVMGVMWWFAWWLLHSKRIRWDITVSMAVALILSFLAVSALYEPDFGSFLRHLTPIMLFMIYCYNTRLPKAKEKIS